MKLTVQGSVILLSCYLISCRTGGDEPLPKSNLNGGGAQTFEWTIPQNEVFDGGVGKDGIPSIDQPKFAPAAEITTIPDWEFIVAIKVGNEIKAYPHNILNWHEIVNDRFGDLNVALTYCPLTGTAIGWERGESTFGVSGLLYNSNLIPYDRISNSYWSQMLSESVRGIRAEERIMRVNVIEVRWQDFREAYPEALVLTRNTGFDRDYDAYPYGNYRGSHDLLFPVSRRDNRLFEKERVLSIQFNGITRVYRFDTFEASSFVYDELGTEEIVVFGNRDMGFISAYRLPQVDGVSIQFIPVADPTLDRFFGDQIGNTWNIFGEVTSGPNLGIQMDPLPSYMGFFFAWAAFNQAVEIF